MRGSNHQQPTIRIQLQSLIAFQQKLAG